MIRYSITNADLEARIELAKKGWLDRARQRTDAFPGRYEEESSMWGEIKEVFMDLQSNKCAYCERKLGGKDYNSKEHEVEHYRPKSSVKPWPSDTVKLERKLVDYDFPVGDESDLGYYLLAYNICNYAVACTGCNSSLKSNYFPVAAKRVLDSSDYTKLGGEEPYLLFPVGDIDDDDPENVITFVGFLPVPKKKAGRRYRRGRVTIDFFDLAVREDLILERADIIVNMWSHHETLKEPYASEERKSTARRWINHATKAESQHANCARAYDLLCQTEPELASQWKDYAMYHSEKLKEKEYVGKFNDLIRSFRRPVMKTSVVGSLLEAFGLRSGQ